jgi:hypothetical protein
MTGENTTPHEKHKRKDWFGREDDSRTMRGHKYYAGIFTGISTTCDSTKIGRCFSKEINLLGFQLIGSILARFDTF